MLQDLRYAVRVFRAHPGITLVAVVSLALGIGANSVMFSFIDGMYLRPLPVRDPDGLLDIGSVSAEGRWGPLSWLDFQDIRRSVPAFSDVAVQNVRGGMLNTEGEAEMVVVTIVSDNFFPLLGVDSARGRLFREDLDVQMQNEPAMAISDSLWKRRFGGDPGIVGRSIRMNNRPFTVVGVLPRAFRSLRRGLRVDVWIPTSTWRAMGNGVEFEARGGQFEPVARLRPGASMEQAKAQLDALSARFQQENPGFRGRKLTLTSGTLNWEDRSLQLSVLMLAIVALLVLIACANVALLLLAQAEGRRREIAIRMAVGAGQRRLVRQLFVESATLAATGGVAALAIAYWLIPVLPALLPPGPDYISYDIRMDGRVLWMTVLTCLATVLLFGLAPALSSARTDLNAVIKGGGVGRPDRLRGRKLLVAVQALLAVVLLTAAGLLARSFLHVQQERIGFDTDREMLVFYAGLPGRNKSAAEVCEELAARAQAVPGVTRAAYCRRVPLWGSGSGATVRVTIPGRVTTSGEDFMRLRFNQISDNYLAASGTRLLAGRGFTRADSAGAARVTLVNRTMAEKFWPGRDPIGEFIRVADADTQIVGVVEDAVIANVHEPAEPFVYFPFAQMPVGEVTFLVETAREPASLLDAVKREMRAAQPRLVLFRTTTLKQHVADARYSDWLPSVLSAGVGVLGMVLAAVGLFGVVMHSVSRRLRELGIRTAIGARSPDLVRMVLWNGLSLAGAGALAGVAVSLAAGRFIAGLLHGVSPYDPVTLAASVSIVVAVAAVASVYPAWRASRVDPITVLRAE